MRLFFLLLYWFCFSSSLHSQSLEKIPSQAIDFSRYLSHKMKNAPIETIPAFDISGFVTYGEYKVYLQAIAQDSSKAFVLRQQPDSSIAPQAEIYAAYVHSDLYDAEPVVGIRWESAMAYCKWKTLQDNPAGSLSFVYRLPTLKEWLSAYTYYEQYHLPTDMNDHFADWLLDSYYFNWYDFFAGASYFPFVAIEDTYSAWKRRMTIGNSYVYSEPSVLYYGFWQFSDTGKRHLGFRIVKEPIAANPQSVSRSLAIHWKLLKK
jgi:formylglycine-generating enzyme required for sulfatase activity